MVPYLRTAIIVNAVVDQISIMFHMSGIIQLTFMDPIFIRVFDIKTDTAVIDIAKILTLVQTFDKLCIYRVVHQTSLSKEIVGREEEFTITNPFWKDEYKC